MARASVKAWAAGRQPRPGTLPLLPRPRRDGERHDLHAEGKPLLRVAGLQQRLLVFIRNGQYRGDPEREFLRILGLLPICSFDLSSQCLPVIVDEAFVGVLARASAGLQRAWVGRGLIHHQLDLAPPQALCSVFFPLLDNLDPILAFRLKIGTTIGHELNVSDLGHNTDISNGCLIIGKVWKVAELSRSLNNPPYHNFISFFEQMQRKARIRE
mmetsp:Transcript_31639/g.84606  ORF Transcript_31639/g.84606 Transcript_31639/m.84606 type:complete len:213 (+) Transcript_31639:203-841(+)